MFNWKRIGKLFDPTVQSPHAWMAEQAQNPFSVVFPDFVRVYFNCRPKRDSEGRSVSLPAFVDLDPVSFNLLRISEKPILELGKPGDFDEFGIMTGCVVKETDHFSLFYVGWTRMSSVPYNWAIGLARSLDEGRTFQRVGRGPILGPTWNEPFLQAGCSAVVKTGSTYSLFYTSGISWLTVNGKPESVYQIMTAESEDKLHWRRTGIPILPPVIENEAQASPSVIRIGEKWHLFFSYRHSTEFRNKDRGYRIGYAWSKDFKKWHRCDPFGGLAPSEFGWDSEMVCYPHVCQVGDRVLLFYCGNDFGRYGFGVVEMECLTE